MLCCQLCDLGRVAVRQRGVPARVLAVRHRGGLRGRERRGRGAVRGHGAQGEAGGRQQRHLGQAGGQAPRRVGLR